VEWIYAEEYRIVDEKEGLFRQVIYYDQDGILWLGTDNGPVKIVAKKKGFLQIGPVSGGGGLNYHKLSAVIVDQNEIRGFYVKPL
jgi:ligand-binding sensor domain-containing protein